MCHLELFFLVYNNYVKMFHGTSPTYTCNAFYLNSSSLLLAFLFPVFLKSIFNQFHHSTMILLFIPSLLSPFTLPVPTGLHSRSILALELCFSV
jgi:hypothetical protein